MGTLKMKFKIQSDKSSANNKNVWQNSQTASGHKI